MYKFIISYLLMVSMLFAEDGIKKERLKFDARINNKKQIVITVRRDDSILPQYKIGNEVDEELLRQIKKQDKKFFKNDLIIKKGTNKKTKRNKSK